MFRFLLTLFMLFALPTSSNAAVFYISGTLTGFFYPFVPGCEFQPQGCPAPQPVTVNFDFPLLPENGDIVTGDDVSGYSFTTMHPLYLGGPASGNFVWDGTSYKGTSFSQSFTATNGAGFSIYTNSFNVTTELPEPATWAMMIVGLGIIALGLRQHLATRTLAPANLRRSVA